MKKIMYLLVMAAALAAIAVPVAMATGNEGGTTPNVYCLNGETVSMPAPISFGNGSITVMLSKDSADIVASGEQGFTGGIFWLGYYKGTTQVFLFTQAEYNSGQVAPDPAPSLNSVAFGACAAAAAAQPDRNFWLCYSSYQTDPAVYSRGAAEALLDEGMWVPYAVKSAVSKTAIGNGVYLTCSIPSGKTPTGSAVSTGGGEAYNAPYAKVPAANRLDYTMLYS